MIERLDHVNVVVEDLDAMRTFYCDVLGLRVAKQPSIRGSWIDAVTGLADVQADVVYLEANTEVGLELICYRAPAGARPAALGVPNTKGIRHIAFRVQDLDRALGELAARGVKTLSQIQQVPAEQVDYAGQNKRIVYCHDPEGNLLELCAFD
jgi:catechol 2,3-dioxygenase-like lactoylglutathione lyase family enzyme